MSNLERLKELVDSGVVSEALYLALKREIDDLNKEINDLEIEIDAANGGRRRRRPNRCFDDGERG
jgi:predicted  nucleic acid-binding Zn-ribbon protein